MAEKGLHKPRPLNSLVKILHCLFKFLAFPWFNNNIFRFLDLFPDASALPPTKTEIKLQPL